MRPLLFLCLVSGCLEPVAAAGPSQCDLTHDINAGDRAPCDNHVSVPTAYLAHLKKAEVALEKTEAALEKTEAKLLDAIRQNDIAREQYEGHLAACNAQVSACEKAHVTDACPTPGLFSRPEFCWPTGIVLGFVGGIVFDREVGPR